PSYAKKTPFSLLKSPRFAKITRFLFENSPLKRKLRVFSLEIPHLCEKRIFSSQIPQLCKNHAFSLRESPI
ncbi:hypothetical protein CP10743SC13_2398, partial [Chlamydia psittaci 10_743_SC13]